MTVDINVVAENLVELLTNSTNMATVFYDIFLNPIPMDVTLYQYNDENVLEEITIPNRAKDRKIALDGVGSPEGSVDANVGAAYVDTASSLVYFKVSGTGNTGWTEVLTADALSDILDDFQPTISTSGTNVVLLDKDGNITSSADIGNISANKSLSNLSSAGNAVLAGKASVDLDNLSSTGEARFTQIQTSLTEKASVNMDNITSMGANNIRAIVGEVGANSDLSNLTDAGNAKLQYAPFSINNGSVTNGANTTLQTVGGVPVSVDTYVVPVLSSNNSEYGTCNDYTMTGTKSSSYSSYTSPWTIELSSDNYIPSGAIVTFTIKTANYGQQYAAGSNYYACGCTGCYITYTYTDNTTEKIFDENLTGNFSGWTFNTGKHSAIITLPVASKTIKSISVTGYASFGQNYNYYNAWGITFKAQYTISSADTLICNPCTITTADGRSKVFDASNVLDCSGEANGTYKVLKNYTSGDLSLSSSVSVQKEEPSTSSNNDLWLDNSKYPLALREYNGTTWNINNDLVYMGDITISSGLITSISNSEFNKYRGLLGISGVIETYRNGNSWYRVYSDGWCVQGGACTSGINVSLLKSYMDTNYALSVPHSAKSVSNFTPSQTGDWISEGYLW